MCGRLRTGFVCENHASCEATRHAATVRQGTTVMPATVTNLSAHGACIELAPDVALELGSWVVLADAGRLRSGCDARIVGIDGRTCRVAFDPGFVMAMQHFGHLVARRTAHHEARAASSATALAVPC